MTELDSRKIDLESFAEAFQDFVDDLIARESAAPMEKLKVGSKLKDNDPRQNGRVITIAGISDDYVHAEDQNGVSRFYLRRRIYCDGKPRKNGFSLIE